MPTPFPAFSQRALEWANSLLQHTSSTTGYAEPVAPQSGYYLLFCSSAVRPFSEAQLADLLEQCQAYNSRHGITGLLCYDQGHFVHLLEGSKLEVTHLFDRILDDPRHHQVRLLCKGTQATQQFSDWHMAFSKADSRDFYWTITPFEAQRYHLLLPQVPVPEPYLPPLYEFSRTCDDLLPRPGPTPRSYLGPSFFDVFTIANT